MLICAVLLRTKNSLKRDLDLHNSFSIIKVVDTQCNFYPWGPPLKLEFSRDRVPKYDVNPSLYILCNIFKDRVKNLEKYRESWCTVIIYTNAGIVKEMFPYPRMTITKTK